MEKAEPVVLVHGRDTAFHAAHVLMEAYDDRDDGDRVEIAKAAACDAVEDE